MSKTVTSYADLKPRSIEDFPGYVAEAAKLERIQNEIANDRAEYQDRVRARNEELSNPVNQQVADYLNNKPLTSAAIFDADNENQQATLLHGIEVKTQALREQQRRTDKAREKASKVICREIMEDWTACEKDLAKKCRALARLGKEKCDLLISMERSQIMLHGDITCQTTMNDSLLWQLNHLADEVDKTV